MALNGDLPAYLAKCRVPECAACRFGKATRVPWRTKGANNKGKLFTVTAPGQCVSVDQLETTTPGLIGQMKGIPTKMQYKVATIFVDHFSRLSFIYLQKSTTSQETVEAKKAFEAYAASMGVKIQHYHADNGRFADKAFVEAVAKERQTISYCGVNAHFQNGIAEKRIRDIQEAARTSILHAQHRWPDAVEANLWPYAIRYQNEIFNSTPRKGQAVLPIELFSRSEVKPKLKHFHPFACPVYVLNNNQQQGKSGPKWGS